MVKSKNANEEIIWKYQVSGNMNYIPKALSITKSGVKKSVEILEGKDEYTINYQYGSDKIIKTIISCEGLSKVLSLYDLKRFITLVKLGRNFDSEYMLNYLLDICKKIKDKLNIKMTEMYYDKERNYFFNYLVIKDGKLQRFEQKVNDIVTLCDEYAIWHCYDDKVRLSEDNNLNETVEFNGVNKRVLSKKITKGEERIAKSKATLEKINS